MEKDGSTRNSSHDITKNKVLFFRRPDRTSIEWSPGKTDWEFLKAAGANRANNKHATIVSLKTFTEKIMNRHKPTISEPKKDIKSPAEIIDLNEWRKPK
jgi:hypothetical protein